MSLIFAKKNKVGNICIVSDTRLNYDPGRKLPTYSDYQKNGGLKLFLVDNRKVAIAFAGLSSEAQDAFDTIDLEYFEIHKVLATLKQSSSSHNTDYLVFTALDKVIYKISDGEITQPSYAYIGDFDGYQLLTKKIDLSSDINELESAMNMVISDSNIKTVGGYCISVVLEGGLFRYVNRHYFSQFKGRIKLSTTPTTIPLVSYPANDTYSYTWTGDENGFAFYFYEAKLGLVYLPLRIYPVKTSTQVGFDDFDKQLSQYNLKLPVRISSTCEEETLIEFSYELYKEAQYQRCIDKISSLGQRIKVNPKVYFQANYLLGCCYKELGIENEKQNITEAIKLLEKSNEYFNILTMHYEPEFSVLINKGIASNYLGYMTEKLSFKKAYFENAVNDFTLSIALDSKKTIPYQNRAAANYELLRFCQSKQDLSELAGQIVEDCDLALHIDQNLQLAANLKMHVLAMLA
ncbi:hypothetical protein [Desulfoluna butyratoxydans]|uniref:Tetratricopeptide-like helical domain n=1 Tax=Desulfoluna butyratoxydans TaxID=231438 RepID=A0A4U8YSI4_9BACT|nr:hypothetical protein [Desulfoluna butyratoxydans]VFQ46724.1 hypothetical protein MSL71_43940 [Desulfoluna butyratoxydans]